MNFSIRDLGERNELDISWDHTDLSFTFDSVRETQTGDIVFEGVRFDEVHINQASGDNIGLLVIKDGDMTFEGRGNYDELVANLARRTEFYRFDESER